jgi:hypothetical protein
MSDSRVPGLRRIRDSWAQTFKLGRHWRLAVEWIPAARSFDFWLYDERKNDGV